MQYVPWVKGLQNRGRSGSPARSTPSKAGSSPPRAAACTTWTRGRARRSCSCTGARAGPSSPPSRREAQGPVPLRGARPLGVRSVGPQRPARGLPSRLPCRELRVAPAHRGSVRLAEHHLERSRDVRRQTGAAAVGIQGHRLSAQGAGRLEVGAARLRCPRLPRLRSLPGRGSAGRNSRPDADVHVRRRAARLLRAR